jgi:AAA+ ATPase superfamily predicted ATPase
MAEGILAQRVRPTFEQYVSYAFEHAARAYITRLARKGKLSFLPERVGCWWDQNTEIDDLAISESEQVLLVGDSKWSANPVGIDILQHLKRRTGGEY